MLLEGMTILEKITALEECLNRADTEVDYAIQVDWLTNAPESKAQARVILDNGHEMFSTGKIETLDEEVKEGMYSYWNQLLNQELQQFPEYVQEQEKIKMPM